MTSSYPLTRTFVRALALTVLFGWSGVAYAVNYEPLVGLPAVAGPGGSGGLAGYFNQLYMLTVAVGAMLAFLKIAFAGAKWSLSEIITDKSEAKKSIQGALLGLAILLIPFIVLNTIYSELTDLNILEEATKVNARITPATTPATPPGATPPSDPSLIAPPSGTDTRWVSQSMACRADLVSGDPQFGTDTYSYDCSDSIRECQAREGGSYTQTTPEVLTCKYLEVTPCSPGINCPGDTGYAAP